MPWPILALAAANALPAIDAPAGQPTSVTAELTRCLRSPEPTTVGTASIVAVPPGLIDDQVKVVSIAQAGTSAFAYEGTRPHALTCGIAIYGRVPGTTRRKIRAILDSISNWRPFKNDQAKTEAGAQETDWGMPNVPTMYGARLIVRRPSASAPTLEVTRYAVLVQ